MRKRNVLFTAVIAAVLMMGGWVQADEIVAYEFTYEGVPSDMVKPTRTDQYITASEYDFYSNAPWQKGYAASGGNPDGVYYARTTSDSLLSYMFFSLTVENGYALQLDDLSFDSKRNVNAATAYNVFYSTDGSVFSTLGSGSLSGTSYESIQADNGGTPILNLTGTTYFQILGSGWSGSANDDQRWHHDNVMVNGSVAAVPEPAALGLIAVSGGTMLFIRRKFLI